jgi:hypothetical protein
MGLGPELLIENFVTFILLFVNSHGFVVLLQVIVILYTRTPTLTKD